MVENRQPECSVTWTQCSLAFYFVGCAHAHSYNQYCTQGLRGPQKWESLEKKSVSEGNFIRGKTVKEELSPG